MSTPNDGNTTRDAPAGDGGGFSSPAPPAATAATGATAAGPDTTPGATTGQLAGFWIRFAGALIDSILLNVVAAIIGVIIGMNTSIGRAVLSLLIAIPYFTYLHGSSGQTVGNRAASIKIVDEQGGGTIGYGRAFVRWLVSLVSGVVIVLGYLWMLWDSKNQTWHDKAARSLVVKT